MSNYGDWQIMRELSSLRENWDEVAKWEAESLRGMTVFETVAELEALFSEFREELDRTEQLYRQERLQYLIELHARLMKLKSSC
jgi:molybdopterin converting factor small subunit